MKTIAIIGTGITGLRAGLELLMSHEFHITFFEKSKSVGGRVATRRFPTGFVNHGAQHFDHVHEVLKTDPQSLLFNHNFNFVDGATNLPKQMRDVLATYEDLISFQFNSKVLRVSDSGECTFDHENKKFDYVLITAPVPQVQEMLGENILSHIIYTKKILFISANQRHELSDEFSEKYFEESDDIIRLEAEKLLNTNLSDLDLKKWRYANVKAGSPEPYYAYSPRVLVAGDAFDPKKWFNLSSAWLSGIESAKHIINTERFL